MPKRFQKASLDKEIEKLEKDKEEKEEKVKDGEKRKEESAEKKREQTPRIISVSIRSGRFDDSTVDVKLGDTVRWVNNDSQTHWPASNPHPVHTGLPGFDALKPLKPGESYEFAFTRSGTFNYHDHLNPAIAGTIIVK